MAAGAGRAASVWSNRDRFRGFDLKVGRLQGVPLQSRTDDAFQRARRGLRREQVDDDPPEVPAGLPPGGELPARFVDRPVSDLVGDGVGFEI